MHDDTPHECKVIHPEVVAAVRAAVPCTEDQAAAMSRFFKAFGDTTRLKILFALRHAEMCVCDIAAVLGMQHSAISHQLNTLSLARLVRQRKRGKIVYYSLCDAHVESLLTQGLEHINE